MYLIDKNNRLHIKFINYYNFSLYKKLIKNICNKQQYCTDNLTIILDLNTFTIISEIGYKLSFNKKPIILKIYSKNLILIFVH